MVYSVSAGISFTLGWISTAPSILSSGTSPPISERAYSWWSDPTSLFFILVLLVIFLSSMIIAWRSPEREERPQTQRFQRARTEIEVSVEPLINALKSTDWEARREVVSALGNTGSENAVDPLIDVLLHDENEQVRETAASWLGRIGAERSVPSFVKIVKNYLAGTEHSTSLVFTSVTALGEIGSTQGLTVLKKLTESLEQSGATENLSKVEHAIKEIGSASDLTNRKCIVCNLPLGKTGELVQCPFCKNIAHKDHMLGWLKGREYCPTCGRPIKDSQLVQVKPGLRASTLRTEPEAKKH